MVTQMYTNPSYYVLNLVNISVSGRRLLSKKHKLPNFIYVKCLAQNQSI